MKSRLLVVENEPKDLKRAADAALVVGFSEVEGKTTPEAARVYLEGRLDDERELPAGIVLDLDFGYESGFELLRYWHSTPKLRSIPVIVWSVMGDEQKKMCDLFKIKQFVGKWEGDEVLHKALESILQPVN
ncbi:MAG TPA: hypothetical protein VKR52_08580 [Terracidiphilus sp.]|nr:hypothetical protein [Terracidiphilus sp.]